MTDCVPPLAINPALALDVRCAPCIHAAFEDMQDSRLFAIAAVDERGELIAIDCAAVHPTLIEVIQTRPRVVRGNHRHRRCSEVLTVTHGALDIYLLCDCPGQASVPQAHGGGASVHLPPAPPMRSTPWPKPRSSRSLSDGDPRLDRERVETDLL